MINPSRAAVHRSVISQIADISTGWEAVLSGQDSISRANLTALLLASLRQIQSMTPVDVCIISSVFRGSGKFFAEMGIDDQLLGVFAEMLKRTEVLYEEALSVQNLFGLYSDLLILSVELPVVIKTRDRCADALLARVRSGELLPSNFKMMEFLDAFSQDVDPPLMKSVSDWALRKVNVNSDKQTDNLIPTQLVHELLAIQRAFEAAKLHPSKKFVEAVATFIS